MNNYKLYLFLILLNFSCENDNLNTQNNINISKNRELKITEQQIIDKFKDINSWVYEFSEENDYEQYYEMKKEDMEIVEYLIIEDLKNKKFNFPDQVVFNKKINQIFGDIKKNPLNFIYDNFSIITGYDCENSSIKKCQEEAEKGNFISDNYIYVFKNFIAPFPYINNMAILKNDKIIRTIPEDYYHINQYLIYNDKNSLRWLKENNKDFLENLITKFGYKEDPELLAWYESPIEPNWIGRYKGTFSDYDNDVEDPRAIVTIILTIYKNKAHCFIDNFYFFENISLIFLSQSEKQIVFVTDQYDYYNNQAEEKFVIKTDGVNYFIDCKYINRKLEGNQKVELFKF